MCCASPNGDRYVNTGEAEAAGGQRFAKATVDDVQNGRGLWFLDENPVKERCAGLPPSARPVPKPSFDQPAWQRRWPWP